MSTIRKILAPVDGSEYMKTAIEWSCTFAKQFNAELTILHVVSLPPSSDIGAMPTATRQLEEAGDKIVEDARRMAEACGVAATARTDFSVGNPGMKIVGIAEAEGFDLIVIGSKGKSRIREFLMGSVANTVANNARCLVMVVHFCD